MLLQKHLRPIGPCRVSPRRAAFRVCCAALRLGPYDFPSKESARDQIRQILRETYQESMIMPDSEYGQLLMDLVQQHPRAADKIGCGVSYFTTARRWLDNVPTKHFVICRTDGTSDDFSYLKCLKLAYVPKPDYAAAAAAPDSSNAASSNSIAAANAASISAYSGSSSPSRRSSSSSRSGSSSPVDQSWSSLQSVEDPAAATAFERFPTATATATVTYPTATYRSALRNAVTSHTASFKAQAFDASALAPMFCPLAGVLLTLDNSRAVETAATPFLDLADAWLQQQGCELEEVQVEFQQPRNSFSRGPKGKPIMSDFQQKFSWQEFYREHVQLQLVSHAGFGNRQNAKNAEKYGGSSTAGGLRDSSFGWAAGTGSSSQGNQQQQQAVAAAAPSRARRVVRRSSSSSAAATSSSEGGGVASIGSEGATSSVQADDSSSWYNSSGSRGANGSSSNTVHGTRSRGSRTRSSKSSNGVSHVPADSVAAAASPASSAGGVDVAGLFSKAFAAGLSADSSTGNQSSSGRSSSSGADLSSNSTATSSGSADVPHASSSGSSEGATAAAPAAGRRRRRRV